MFYRGDFKKKKKKKKSFGTVHFCAFPTRLPPLVQVAHLFSPVTVALATDAAAAAAGPGAGRAVVLQNKHAFSALAPRWLAVEWALRALATGCSGEGGGGEGGGGNSGNGGAGSVVASGTAPCPEVFFACVFQRIPASIKYPFPSKNLLPHWHR